jgi:hypothetical protein
VSIVRVGLSETRGFGEGWEAIFGKKKAGEPKKVKGSASRKSKGGASGKKAGKKRGR